MQQCTKDAPLRELKPPMQYYSAVQRLCNASTTAAAAGAGAGAGGAVANASLELELGGEEAAAVAEACRTCSALSGSPDKVVVQATQANCPDPLGELAGRGARVVQACRGAACVQRAGRQRRCRLG